MQCRLPLRPGQRGTKRLARRFGDRLVAVRYRYDTERRRRVKTVELIVDEAPWEPPASTLVAVRVRLDEPVLRGRVKEAGGRWDPRRKVGVLPYGASVRWRWKTGSCPMRAEASIFGYPASSTGALYPDVDASPISRPAV